MNVTYVLEHGADIGIHMWAFLIMGRSAYGGRGECRSTAVACRGGHEHDGDIEGHAGPCQKCVGRDVSPTNFLNRKIAPSIMQIRVKSLVFGVLRSTRIF